MNARSNGLLAGLFVLCLGALVPQWAAAGTLIPIKIEDSGPDGVATTPPQATTGTCVLQPGPLGNLVYVLSDLDSYRNFAWRIPFGSCTACPAPQVLQVNSMAFRVRYFGACTVRPTAEVMIVGATGDAGCRVPDTTRVLCPPVSYTLENPSGAISVTYTLPLSSGCCVSGEAFALVRFSGLWNCSSPSLTPGLAASSTACTTCDQFVTSTIYPDFSEWCFSGGFPVWVQLDTDCCAATTTQPQSWGKIKSIYH